MKAAEKKPCKYCLTPIAPRGMLAHVHFKHQSYVIREFSLEPAVWGWGWVYGAEYGGPPDLSTRALPVVSVTPHWWAPMPMLAPCDKARRWV